LAVLYRVGGRHHNDRSVPAAAALAQVVKNFKAILPGQVDVENHQTGAGLGFVEVRLIEKGRRLFAIFENFHQGGNSSCFDRLSYEVNIRWIVFDDDDMRISEGLLTTRGG
jgi:hypothetical protein